MRSFLIVVTFCIVVLVGTAHAGWEVHQDLIVERAFDDHTIQALVLYDPEGPSTITLELWAESTMESEDWGDVAVWHGPGGWSFELVDEDGDGEADGVGVGFTPKARHATGHVEPGHVGVGSFPANERDAGSLKVELWCPGGLRLPGNCDHGRFSVPERGALRIILAHRTTDGGDDDWWGERSWRVYEWARRHEYVGGFPNWHQADYGNGVVFGGLMLTNEAGAQRDIPVRQMGIADGHLGLRERFRAVNALAIAEGYAGAFPNGHRADYPDRGLVCGSMFVRSNYADRVSVSLADLGLPNFEDMAAVARAVSDYGTRHSYVDNDGNRHGYVSGFPTYLAGDSSDTMWVVLLKPGGTVPKDVPASEL